MLSIQAVRGLPRLRAPGIVPCMAIILLNLNRFSNCFSPEDTFVHLE